jgi:hypothetical protein
LNSLRESYRKLMRRIFNVSKQFKKIGWGTTPHEAEVTSLNPHSPSCVDMSKKIK